MIIIKPINQQWEPGKILMKGATDEEKRRFENYVADLYVKEYKKVIQNQTYKPQWPPLSRAYLKQKREEGLSLKTWEATGQLKNSLTYKKGSRYVSYGNIRHKKDGTLLNHIARKLEYGDLITPPRPLFRLLYRNMSKNMGKIYERYRREGKA